MVYCKRKKANPFAFKLPNCR
uniref:Uncharacterized protein n=1 Tax=Arundo donax TaxID=35708 RepID=A0A0A9FII9_ARUDO